jgi:phosphatidylglycerophosphatase C
MTPVQNPATTALFDLDGTLTWRDTLLPFLLAWLAAHPRRLSRLWRLSAAIAAYATEGRNRGVLKARLIHMALGADRRSEIDAWARQFVAGMPARGFFRPAALATLERHRRAGDRLVLLSASPDLYVPYIGALLGFTQTVCTEMSWHGERLDGTLRSENRLGEEKVRVLSALRAAHPGRRVVAYGNSRDDLAHLCRADEALLVNADRRTRALGASAGLATAEWR